MVSGRAAAVEGNEDKDVGNGNQEVGCSCMEEVGPQDISDGEPSEECMAQFIKAVDLYQQRSVGVSDVGVPST